jgi:hypothetical protein
MVPTLRHNSLVSTSKLADANYHTVFTPNAVGTKQNTCMERMARSRNGLMESPTGQQCNKRQHRNQDTTTGRGKPNIQRENTQRVQSVPTRSTWLPNERNVISSNQSRMFNFMARPKCHGDQQTLSRISRNTKGHMKHQRQGVRSTKIPKLQADITMEEQIELEKEMKALRQKHRDIFIQVYEEKDFSVQ